MAEPAKIIVTGAAQGIGHAVALRMAAAGACIAVWDTQTDGAEQTASLCRGKGAQSLAWRVDVGVADEVESAVAAFEREWGRPEFFRARVRSTWSSRNGSACCESI